MLHLLFAANVGQVELDLLRYAIRHQNRMLFFQKSRDGFVNFVACDANRVGQHNAAHRNQRNLGCAAADIHNKAALRLIHGEPGSQRGGKRLLNHENLPRADFFHRVDYRAPLDLADVARHCHHHARTHKAPRSNRLADKVVDHDLRHLVIDDHAVPQGVNNADISARAADHLLRAVAYGDDIARPLAPCDDHGRLVDDDALVLDINAGIIRADIYRDIRRNKLKTCH